MAEVLYQLPFDPVLQILEERLASLPLQAQYNFVIQEFVRLLLEELSVKIWDREATSHINMGLRYLELLGVSEVQAQEMCHSVFNAIFGTVVSCFPRMTFQELAAGRYLLDSDLVTLLVYLKQPQYA